MKTSFALRPPHTLRKESGLSVDKTLEGPQKRSTFGDETNPCLGWKNKPGLPGDIAGINENSD